ncbi:uncharacterized protein LOC119691638 [Plutella xylostella]|nr:uncharacterized protein LOC119691638 [Plutella xylostella]
MSKIILIPREFSGVIPTFNGDGKLLRTFLTKCEYVINAYKGDNNPEQELYLYHLITSKLVDKAAVLISERQDIESWQQLKEILTQSFGDKRSEECIAIELETLKINPQEDFSSFYSRIQHIKSALIAKVNLLEDQQLRKSKVTIYENLAKNVFLYNLPEDLIRIVRLKECNSIESALSIVLEEVNFKFQYQSRNNMLKNATPTSKPPQLTSFNNQNSFRPPAFLQQGFRPLVPQNNQFKFGIPQNQPYVRPNFQPTGYRPNFQPTGYRPNFQPTGYRPNLPQNQFKFGIPNQNLQRPQFKFGIPNQQFHPYKSNNAVTTDVSMRTAPVKQFSKPTNMNQLFYNELPYEPESEQNQPENYDDNVYYPEYAHEEPAYNDEYYNEIPPMSNQEIETETENENFQEEASPTNPKR